MPAILMGQLRSPATAATVAAPLHRPLLINCAAHSLEKPAILSNARRTLEMRDVVMYWPRRGWTGCWSDGGDGWPAAEKTAWLLHVGLWVAATI